MESALARTPAGGPENGGVASGIATIGAHGPGSGHAHGGSLINAAVSGAMSDVAFGTPLSATTWMIMAFQRIDPAADAPFFLCASGPCCLAPPFLVNYRMLCRWRAC